MLGMSKGEECEAELNACLRAKVRDTARGSRDSVVHVNLLGLLRRSASVWAFD